MPRGAAVEEGRAGLLSGATFSWVYPLLRIGYSRPLELADIAAAHSCDEARPNANALAREWSARAERSLLYAVVISEAPTLTFSGVFKLVSDLLAFVAPLAIAGIIAYVSACSAGINESSSQSGWIWVGVVAASTLLQNFGLQQHHELVMHAGLRVRSALNLMVHDHALSVAPSVRQRFGAGAILNLQSSDALAVASLLYYIHYAWAGPLQFIIAMGLLYRELGPPALVGVAVAVALIPAQSMLGSLTSALGKTAAAHADARVRLLSEALAGVRIVKLMALEASFSARISAARAAELAARRRIAIVAAANAVLLSGGPMLVALFSFATFALAGRGELTPQIAFTSLVLFSILRLPLTILPTLVSTIAAARVSAARLSSFLRTPVARDYRTVCAGTGAPPGADRARGEASDLEWATTTSGSTRGGIGEASESPTRGLAHAAAGDGGSLDFDASLSLPLARALPAVALAAGDEAQPRAWLQEATLKWGDAEAEGAGGAAEAARLSPSEPPLAACARSAPARGFRLARLSLTFPRGLTLLVGRAGAGKSSLLAALLGDMVLVSGVVGLAGEAGDGAAPHARSASADASAPPPPCIAYAPQQPFLLSASVRENILFGRPYRSAPYSRVLHACALAPDCAAWPAGDLTEIGERGVTCSGGQRARLSLARALYAVASGDGDRAGGDEESGSAGAASMVAAKLAPPPPPPPRLVLLDDVLSAVDAHVAAHILVHAIGELLLGGGGSGGGGGGGASSPRCLTVIMASHNLSLAPLARQIVVLADGRVAATGPYALLAGGGGADAASPSAAADAALFPSMLRERGRTMAALVEARDRPASAVDPAPTAAAAIEERALGLARPRDRAMPQGGAMQDVGEKQQGALMAASAAAPAATAGGSKVAEVIGKTITDETRALGAVSLSLYARYLSQFGCGMLSTTLATLALASGAGAAADIWLSVWSTAAADGATPPSATSFYIGVYAGITVSAIALVLLQSGSWACGSTAAAGRLHASMLAATLRSPMSFYDTTPAGRILNRFTADIGAADVSLPASFSLFLTNTSRVAATLVVIAVLLPATLLALLPLLALYAAMHRFYRRSLVALKRLDSLTRSPIVAHLTEALAGVATLRAAARLPAVSAEAANLIDVNFAVFLTLNQCNRWLGLRLDWLGTLLLTATAVAAVASAGSAPPALAALALTYSVAVCGLFNWIVRSLAETESFLAAVERIDEYSALPRERPPVIETCRPPPGWPSAGAIEIDDLCVRYRPALPDALSGIRLRIPGGARVGIAGRTGSGKSSLVLALFRILEPRSGAIRIDGLDIAALGLDDLRSRLSIIPQDPVLFAGSLRYNLDPLGEHGDAALAAALEGVSLLHFFCDAAAARAAAVRKGDSGVSAERHAPRASATPLPSTPAPRNDAAVRIEVPAALATLEHAGSATRAALDYALEEGGANLSVGQRQLVQVARALLRGSRVLVLDEASASISGEDDAALQRTLAALRGVTLLVIAHRVSTLLGSDAVLVLDASRVAEYDAPAALLANPASIFGSLVRESSRQREAPARADSTV